MRPVSEIRACPVVLLFDVDDTLTTDGRLEAVALSAMWRAYEAGIRTVAVTGRPLGWAEVIAWSWPVHVAVGENGAGWIWREGKRLRAGYFEHKSARIEQRERLERLKATMAARVPSLPLAGDQGLRRCDLAWDIGEAHCASEDEIELARTVIASAGMRATSSSVHLHAVPGAWNKADGALRALADRFGMDRTEAIERTVFVGDSGNDAEAFACFPTSVGVANVRAHLPALPVPPRFVTHRPRGAGFAELVDRLLTLPEHDGR